MNANKPHAKLAQGQPCAGSVPRMQRASLVQAPCHACLVQAPCRACKWPALCRLRPMRAQYQPCAGSKPCVQRACLAHTPCPACTRLVSSARFASDAWIWKTLASVPFAGPHFHPCPLFPASFLCSLFPLPLSPPCSLFLPPLPFCFLHSLLPLFLLPLSCSLSQLSSLPALCSPCLFALSLIPELDQCLPCTVRSFSLGAACSAGSVPLLW